MNASDILTYDEACAIRDSIIYMEDGKMKVREDIIMPQEGFQEEVLSSPADIRIIGGNRGGGKCLNINELVCTPFGFRRIGDLKKGDIITGLDGGMQKVLYNSYNGVKKLYKVTFVDGSSVTCSADHLWNVKRSNYRSKKRCLYELPLESDFRTWTTEMMIEHMLKQVGKKQPQHLSVPLCEPVKFTVGRVKYRPKFDPYVIGALLGDGCITENMLNNYRVDFESMDNEIIEIFTESGVDMSCFSFKKNSKSNSYRIYDRELRSELTILGIGGKSSINKFIPSYYKTASVDERWSIIQGLMDTDGTIQSDGKCSFTTISEQLAIDVKYMINSLGGIATITKSPAGYKDKYGNYVKCNDSYDVYIRVKDNSNLFRLKRKKDRVKQYNGGISLLCRRIISIEECGEGEVCCIAVSNPDSLYLTNDFIVTHNSIALILDCLYDIENPRFSARIFRREKDDLKRGLWKDTDTFFGDFGDKITSDLLWRFNETAEVKFEHIADENKADQRFRGGGVPYFAFDEINQFSEETFWTVLTSNRNAHGIKNRINGTTNPDIDSWIYKLIKWWINDDGTINDDRDRKIRYFYKYGKTIDEIIWGNTKEDVYRKAKVYIDKYYSEQHSDLVSKYDLIKSLQFIKGDVYKNKLLLVKDPSYIGNIANNGEEAVTRELLGVWRKFEDEEELITAKMMSEIFDNIQQTDGRGGRWLTVDVAMEGGDKFIIWVWDDWHIIDLIMLQNVTGYDVLDQIVKIARRYKIPNNRIIYDAIGMGAFLGSKYKNRGFIPNSIAFTSSGSPKNKDAFYDLNAEITNDFIIKLQDKEISIAEDVLNRVITIKDPSGKITSQKTVAEHLQLERKAVRWLKEGGMVKGRYRLIPKKEMRKIIGGSPDFIDAMKMRIYASNKPQFSNTLRYLY